PLRPSGPPTRPWPPPPVPVRHNNSRRDTPAGSLPPAADARPGRQHRPGRVVMYARASPPTAPPGLRAWPAGRANDVPGHEPEEGISRKDALRRPGGTPTVARLAGV